MRKIYPTLKRMKTRKLKYYIVGKKLGNEYQHSPAVRPQAKGPQKRSEQLGTKDVRKHQDNNKTRYKTYFMK